MILIADTETTGIAEEDEICEVAFLEVDVDLNILSEFQSLVKPTIPIKPQASAASHITDRMVEDSPTIAEAFESCPIDFSEPLSIVAHNSAFDRRFLKPYWNIESDLCSLKAARIFYPNAPDHKLQTLRYYLDLDINVAAHRAMADVLITHGLLSKICSDFKLNLQDIFEEVSRPREVTVMPFGQYKGTLIRDIPRKYVAWALQNIQNLEPPLREALEKRIKC